MIWISNIIGGRYEDGPGLRTVIFFQGCSRKCKGCHNRSTWDKESGMNLSIEDILKILNNINNPLKKVTISGGEPLDQLIELKKLVIELYKAGYEIALYTSYEIQKVPKDILRRLKYLKTGKYIEKYKIENKFYGSYNQKFLELEKGMIVSER